MFRINESVIRSLYKTTLFSF